MLGRDDTLTLEEEMSVADFTLTISSWSAFNTYQKRHGAAAAQKILDDFQKK